MSDDQLRDSSPEWRAHPCFAEPQIVDADAGVIEFGRPRRKVAIVGFASSTRDSAPFTDPDWLIIGLNQLYRWIPRADLWAEIHHREMFLRDQVREPSTTYLDWLRRCPVPILMCDRQPDIPMSVRYPLERACKVGRDYFTSTPAFLVAWALLQPDIEEIGLWGIDLIVGREYDYEKPCLEYWLGVAEARGVTVTLPSASAVLKQLYRYGYQDPPEIGPITRSHLAKRRDFLQSKLVEWQQSAQQIEGAIAELDNYVRMLEVVERGGQLPPG